MAFGLALLLLQIAHVRAAQSVAVALCLAFYFAATLREKHISTYPREILLCLVTWVTVATASCLWSPEPRLSLDLVALAVWLPSLLFLAAIRIGGEIRGPNLVSRGLIAGLGVLCLSVLSALALGRLDILQSGGGPGLDSHLLMRWYPGPGLGSTFVLMALPMVYWLYRERLARRSVAGLLGLALLAAGTLTFSRAFWPGLFALAGALVISTEAFRRHFGSPRRLLALLALLIVTGPLLVIGSTLIRDQQSLSERGVSAAVDRLATDPRLRIWKEWVQLGSESPFLGTGYGKEVARHVHADELKAHVQAGMDPAGYTHPHNVFLSMWVQTGLLGLVCFVALLSSVVRHAWRMAGQAATVRHTAAALFALMIAIITKLATDDFYDKVVPMLMWSYAGILIGYARARLTA